jgi:hypothetical protein
MAEFSQELALWLNPPQSLRAPEVSEVTKERVRAVVADTQEVELQRKRLRAHVEEQLTSLRAEFTGLGLLVESITGMAPEHGVFPEQFVSSQLSELSHLPDAYYVGAWGLSSHGSTKAPRRPDQLRRGNRALHHDIG